VAERSRLTGATGSLAKSARILRVRKLPCRGQVLVKVGDHLEPADVVARCSQQEQVVVLDLARALDVGLEDVEEHVLVRPGEPVEPGTLVASRPRRWRRSFCIHAGLRGNVIGLREGSLFLRGSPDWVQLRAYLPGEVSEIIPERGAIMQASGTVVRGVWGSGTEENGILSVMADSAGDPLPWRRVTRDQYGMILVAGTLQSALALERAALHHVAGIITGSLHPELRPICRSMPFPVVVTEGMGRIAMASPVFSALQEHEGDRAVLAGDARLAPSGPELIIPYRVEQADYALSIRQPPAVGALVRLTGYARLGQVGEIVSLPSEPQITAVGESVMGAWVRLADRRLVFVPLQNLEVLAATAPDPLALLR